MTPELTKKAIAANIEALRAQLSDCFLLSSEAFQAIQQGEQNQAIGYILDFDRMLGDALALYRAAVALHRTGRAP
jgi:hypothetical protein